MQFAGLYEGKKHLFFIKIDKPEEFEILRPYFLITTSSHPRKGNIMHMDCLFSSAIWHGSQRHGYGYSWCADVYGTLCNIIMELYGSKIDKNSALFKWLDAWNFHDNVVNIPHEVCEELRTLNDEKFNEIF